MIGRELVCPRCGNRDSDDGGALPLCSAACHPEQKMVEAKPIEHGAVMKAAREAIADMLEAWGGDIELWLRDFPERTRAVLRAGIEAATQPAEAEAPLPYVAPPRDDEPSEGGVKWLGWFFDRVFEHGTAALTLEDWRRGTHIVEHMQEPAEAAPSDAEIEAAWQRVLLWISEIPYRFSPDDVPGAMVVTEEELRGIVDDELVRPLRRNRQPADRAVEALAHLRRCLTRAEEIAAGAESGGTEAEEIQPLVERIIRTREALRGLVEAWDAAQDTTGDGGDLDVEKVLSQRANLEAAVRAAKEVLRG